MMFFLHVFLFLYGLLAVVVGKLRTSGPMWEAADSKLYELADSYFPESVFQTIEPNTTEVIPSMGRTYLIGGGLMAYSLHYLMGRHRG